VPVAPLASPANLPLPTPQGTLIGEGGYLAYQTRGLDVRPTAQRLRVLKNEDFAPFWPAASRRTPPSWRNSYAFRREGGAPVLRVQLFSQPPVVQAVQDVRLRVDGRIARFRAAVELTAPQNDLSLAEWDLVGPQPPTVSGVTGAGVAQLGARAAAACSCGWTKRAARPGSTSSAGCRWRNRGTGRASTCCAYGWSAPRRRRRRCASPAPRVWPWRRRGWATSCRCPDSSRAIPN